MPSICQLSKYAVVELPDSSLRWELFGTPKLYLRDLVRPPAVLLAQLRRLLFGRRLTFFKEYVYFGFFPYMPVAIRYMLVEDEYGRVFYTRSTNDKVFDIRIRNMRRLAITVANGRSQKGVHHV